MVKQLELLVPIHTGNKFIRPEDLNDGHHEAIGLPLGHSHAHAGEARIILLSPAISSMEWREGRERGLPTGIVGANVTSPEHPGNIGNWAFSGLDTNGQSRVACIDVWLLRWWGSTARKTRARQRAPSKPGDDVWKACAPWIQKPRQDLPFKTCNFIFQGSLIDRLI